MSKQALEDRVAVITGASGEIGAAIAKTFSTAGAKVVLHCRSRREPVEELAAQIIEDGREAEVWQGELKDSKKVAGLMDLAMSRFGQLDILVNSAGESRDALMLLQASEEWWSIQESNLLSTFLCCQEALRFLLRRPKGAIVNVSSLSGLIGLPGQTAYSASKAGILGLTRALAREVGAKNIRVNAIAPGFIDTSWVRETAIRNLQMDQIPMRRMGTPEEVAGAALFLASDLSSYITGTVLNVSGGLYTGAS